jgi:FkbH-like protein
MGDVSKGILISDFNIENLAAYLRNDSHSPRVECEVTPYGQIIQSLLASASVTSDLDFAVVWSRPEAVLPSLDAVLAGRPVSRATVLRDVDDYCEKLILAGARARVVFVPTWVVSTFHHGHGMLDLAPDLGVARLLMHANLRLLENLDRNENVVPLNASKWIELAGERAFNHRLWYTSKTPFGNQLLKAAAGDIKAALRGLRGQARKLVILDLDDTLWGGIVGDVGWENLVLGGHDPTGEAFVDFQRDLKALTRRGIILAIVSKNEEITALEAIQQHPEMVLRQDDFAGWRINWSDKAQNIADLCAGLKLGLDATVFIDDNPIERARVSEALPDVLVPDWPEDKRLYPHALRSLDCFEKPVISEEDRGRAQMYADERERTALRTKVGSVEEWLTTLTLTVRVEVLGPTNSSRITQLLNKTNQMNLSTRRMTGQELLSWANAEGRHVWGFHVSDRFGDSGLTGILGVEVSCGNMQIVDFVLSCRAMGRKIEETMLHVAVDWARRTDVNTVCAKYVETDKNKPCLRFFERSGLRCENGTFVWDTTRPYPCPAAIGLLTDVGQAANAAIAR